MSAIGKWLSGFGCTNMRCLWNDLLFRSVCLSPWGHILLNG